MNDLKRGQRDRYTDPLDYVFLLCFQSFFFWGGINGRPELSTFKIYSFWGICLVVKAIIGIFAE